MPDRLTPTLGDRQLDDRIRRLVATAVADAPPAPTIDEHTLEEFTVLRRNTLPEPNRNRWIAGGLAGLTVAAAVVALVFVSRPDDIAEPPAPATLPPATTPAPTAVLPGTTAPSSDATVPATAPEPAPVTDPPPTDPLATQPAPPETATASLITAGPGGVSVTDANGSATVTSEAATYAIRTADGATYLQRTIDPNAGASIWVVQPGATAPTQVALPAEITGTITLHDAAAVGGETVLLVEEQPPTCAGGNDCEGALWAVRPATGTADQITTMNTWESGWSQLGLTTEGVVVGAVNEGPVVLPFSIVIPGAVGSPVDFALLGLEEQYVDCAPTCPSAFTIDSTGQYVAWLERPDAGGPTIGLAATDGSVVLRIPLVATGDIADFGDLDIADVVIDAAGTATGRSIFNPRATEGDTAPMFFDLASGEQTDTDVRILNGWAAFGA